MTDSLRAVTRSIACSKVSFAYMTFLKRLREGVLFLLFLNPLLESRMHCLKNSRRFIDWSFDRFIDSLAANRPRFLLSSISQAKSLRKFVCSSLGTVCNDVPLGIQDLSIPNCAISASSFEADSPPSSARIYNLGGWRALSNDTSPYLEVSQ